MTVGFRSLSAAANKLDTVMMSFPADPIFSAECDFAHDATKTAKIRYATGKSTVFFHAGSK
jgi:hypothetical protein